MGDQQTDAKLQYLEGRIHQLETERQRMSEEVKTLKQCLVGVLGVVIDAAGFEPFEIGDDDLVTLKSYREKLMK